MCVSHSKRVEKTKQHISSSISSSSSSSSSLGFIVQKKILSLFFRNGKNSCSSTQEDKRRKKEEEEDLEEEEEEESWETTKPRRGAMREVERHDAQRSSSGLGSQRRRGRGKRRVSRENDRGGCLCGSFWGVMMTTTTTTTTTTRRRRRGRRMEGSASSDRGRTMMRLFAEDFLYFSLVSLVNTTNDARSERNPSRYVRQRKDTQIASVASTALMLPCDIVSSSEKERE